MPGATEEAGPSVIWLHEEYHPQPAEASPASHKGRLPHTGLVEVNHQHLLLKWRVLSVMSELWFPLSETAGAGWTCRAAEGPSALGAERAAGSAGAAAEGLREDAQQQSGLGHVIREVRLRQRWVLLPWAFPLMSSSSSTSEYFLYYSDKFKPS